MRVSPEARQRKAESQRELRARYQAGGLCIQCGMAEVAKYLRCAVCRRKMAKSALAWYYRHRADVLEKQRLRSQAWRERQKAA